MASVREWAAKQLSAAAQRLTEKTKRDDAADKSALTQVRTSLRAAAKSAADLAGAPGRLGLLAEEVLDVAERVDEYYELEIAARNGELDEKGPKEPPVAPATRDKRGEASNVNGSTETAPPVVEEKTASDPPRAASHRRG